MFHKMDLPLLLLVVIIAIGLGEMISSVKLPEPPQDGAAGLHLYNGLDDCGEDTHSSCDSWAKSAECEMDPFVKQNCSFSCSISGRLWEAAWTGNLSAVDSAIAAGANTLCAKTSNVTNTLCPKTSNVTGDNLDNYTAIHMAASAGHPGIVNKLLIAGVDVNLQTTEGKTPIHIAVLSGSINALDILIENNGNVNLPDNNTIDFFPGSTGWTPLMYAAWSGKLNITRALIRANASLDVTGGSWNVTALNYAVSRGNQDVALLLIEHDANVNIPSSAGVTPLIAASDGQLNTTRALIKANASLDVTGGYLNATALYYAASESNQDIALLLIEHDANVNIPSSYGLTPLIAAASVGQLNTTRALIKANASLDVTGGDYNATALYYAVRERNNQDVALLLIEHNANVNIPGYNGWTPLMTAAWRGELNITRALIKANASLDVTEGVYNATALHYAVESNFNQDLVVLLMDNGADSSITNNLGFTPADLARSKGHNQLADLIEGYPTTHRLILSR